MKTIIVSVAIMLISTVAVAQKKYYSKTATLSFVNKTNIETISANNKSAAVVIDSKTGAVSFSALIKSFTFEKALMQQHFNDNYMESGKFPKSEFKGKISNNADVKYTTDGTYSAKVAGKLTMHGVTKDVSTTATIVVKSGKVTSSGSFTVTLKDYGIKDDKIAKTATISFNTGTLSEK
jgi:polyisoprenoid-binding protein YceI